MPEGIKHDNGKLRLAEMMLDFQIPMEELCKVWEFGANKYTKSNWKHLDSGIDRYTNALLRHLFAENDNMYDDESKLLHAAHIAFNALARLYFIKKLLDEKNELIDTPFVNFLKEAPGALYEIPPEETKYVYGSRQE